MSRGRAVDAGDAAPGPSACGEPVAVAVVVGAIAFAKVMPPEERSTAMRDVPLSIHSGGLGPLDS